jgi:hypothetical protein
LVEYEVKYGDKPPRVQKPGRAKGARMGAVEAKRLCLKAIQNGRTVREAMAEVGRSEKTYEYWKTTDKVWREELRLIRDIKAAQNNVDRGANAGSFEEFRREYLGMETFPHQMRWIDIIEGRPPRDLHPSMTYEEGDPQYVLINTPPEHAKSTVLSVDYVTYRICKDPNVRIIICSANQDLAKQFMFAVKNRLTHPRYAKLQLAFAPAEGFDGKGAIWSATQVYLSGDSRDTGEKDPTLQALGIRGRIYGSRADLILLDDCATLGNASEWQAQIRWLRQDVITRLGPGGLLLIAGTRVDPIDMYKMLRQPDQYPEGVSPWTYLSQPAVLEFDEDPDKWVTLWPRSDSPWPGSRRSEDAVADADGLYPRWDGYHLARRRRMLDAQTWSMAYQQMDVSEDAIFPAEAVRACINGRRNHGALDGDNPYHERPMGMNDLYVVCSMDPAMAGETATVVYAVDLKTGKRYVLDAHRMASPRPSDIKNLIFAWTDTYKPSCWVIEKNAFQLYLTRDEEIRAYLANRGCAMVEHYTSNNKMDPDFGVASLAPLFIEKQISLPSAHNCEGVKALVEQFITWRPGVKGSKLVQDFPMATWFAELKVREVMDQALGRMNTHFNSKFTPRYRQAARRVVSVGGFEDTWHMN